MKTFLGMKTVSKPEFRNLAWDITDLGWSIGRYEMVEPTNEYLKLYYADRAIECLKRIRKMDSETYGQLRAVYRATIVEMNSTIKNQ